MEIVKQVPFSVNEGFLGPKQLVEGRMYLVKDGRLILYIGQDTIGRFAFYNIANCLYTIQGSGCILAHDPIQQKYLNAVADEVLSSGSIDPRELNFYKGVPKLCREFSNKDYSVIANDLYNNSRRFFPKLPMLASRKNTVTSLFIKSADLIPGVIYYSGDRWRSTYCYLGRTRKGYYLWYYIGNAKDFLNSSVQSLVSQAEVTKANKKVKAYDYISNDPDAFRSMGDTELLIKGYRKNREEVEYYAKKV